MEERELIYRYIEDIRKHPLLTDEETLQLLKLSKAGCKQSFNKLVVSNLRFVISIAKDYIGLGLPLLDLINEGNLGLIIGLRKFEHEKGKKITTYVVYWIRQKMMRALCERGGNDIRLPGHRHHELIKIKHAAEQAGTDVVKISEVTGIPVETIEDILMASSFVCLDDAYNIETKSFLPYVEDKLLLEKMLKILNDTEKKIVVSLYIDEQTPAEVAGLLHMDIKKVKSLRHIALKKLKKAAIKIV